MTVFFVGRSPSYRRVFQEDSFLQRCISDDFHNPNPNIFTETQSKPCSSRKSSNSISYGHHLPPYRIVVLGVFEEPLLIRPISAHPFNGIDDQIHEGIDRYGARCVVLRNKYVTEIGDGDLQYLLEEQLN
jgi:hypothetical protein